MSASHVHTFCAAIDAIDVPLPIGLPRSSDRDWWVPRYRSRASESCSMLRTRCRLTPTMLAVSFSVCGRFPTRPQRSTTTCRELADTPGADGAVAFVTQAYGTRVTRTGRTIEHPIAVAMLLADDGQPSPTVVVGILHDVLEDTDVSAVELEGAFGAEITRAVTALSEDPSIRKYGKRKAALRQAILDAGPNVATVSLADKVAKLQGLQSRPAERKLRHYRQTLSGIEQRYGRSRLSELLRRELERWPES
jgi:hypothetical protein